MNIENIVAKQRAYFASNATKPVEFRINALKSLKAALLQYQQSFNDSLKAELNKHEMETYMTETGMVLEELNFHIRHLKSWARIKTVPTPMAQFHAKSFVMSEPYGVALIISPWNYPVQLSFTPLIGAISAGNCAIIKPSSYTPATSRIIAELVESIFPQEYIAVVEGGRQENSKLLDQKFDYIFFTGSTHVGHLVMEAASKHLTPVTLELGGKSPVIIDQTADLKLAARRIAFGKVLNAGQTCVAPDYLLIHQKVRDDFIQYFRQALDAFFPGEDMKNMPVIVNEKHFKRLVDLMKSGKAVIGGRVNESRRFIEPTVLVDVSPDSPVMKEEIFGPILPVLTYERLDEAIDFINARKKPLALYVFTNDKSAADTVLTCTSSGGGCWNDTIIHLATTRMGFGGVGDSGMGSYHGKLSFDTFTHYKSIVKKSNLIDLPMRYHPYTQKKLGIIRKFLK
ncbi:MAG: aldehyde dehydrogenase [Caldicoprobacterales bacterium]|jgi:aldehyde dehydrogenase (NAD+)|nr:aldehyde dehydrogenase [Clostridiales bacterium]